MHIAISTANFYTLPFVKALDIIKQSGFEFVELDGHWQGGDGWETAQHIKNCKPKDVIQMVLDSGLKIASFHDMGGVIEDGINSVVSGVTYEYLECYDFPCVVFHTPCIRDAKAYRWNEYKKNMQQELQSISQNRIVCIENMKEFDGYYVPILSPLEMLEFANDAGISVTMDTTHFAQCNVDIASAAEILKNVVKTIHLSDYRNGRSHISIGDGDLDFVSFFHTLNLEGLYMTTIECEIQYSADKERLTVEKCSELKSMVENLTKDSSYE